MTDPIDEIIEREWEDWFPERVSEFEHQRLRAVCEAGHRRGYESASLAHGKSDTLARRKLAREILGYGDVVLMVRQLREIAEEGE